MPWEVKKLGDICYFQNGFAFKSNTYREKGLPILRITNIQDQNIDINNIVYFNQSDYKEDFNKYKVLNGDLVIAMSGATTGKLGLNNSDTIFYLNQRVGKFIPKKELNKYFLYYFLLTKVEENLKIAAGAAQPNLSTEQINNFLIPCPSLSEQKQIVAILDSAFEKIKKAKANTEQNLRNSIEIFQSYLESIFENKGENWGEKELGEILIIERGGSPRPIENFLTNDKDGINWIKIGDTKITDKYIYSTNQKIKPEGLKHTRLVKPGDFLLSNSMSFGRPYILKITGAIHDGWLVLREKENDKINKDFLYYILSSNFVFNQFDKLAAGSTVRNLNINLVSKVRIPIIPVDQQKQIVKELDRLSAETKKLESIYEKKLADLEELKKSILEKAFKGELTKVIV